MTKKKNLATNVLDPEELPAEKMLSEYKAQQSCERGFRFLKDPLFLADSVFVKNQLGKLTDKPTLRWIFQVLQGIHWVVIEGEKYISNLTAEIRDILKYFSVYCQNYYLIN